MKQQHYPLSQHVTLTNFIFNSNPVNLCIVVTIQILASLLPFYTTGYKLDILSCLQPNLRCWIFTVTLGIPYKSNHPQDTGSNNRAASSMWGLTDLWTRSQAMSAFNVCHNPPLHQQDHYRKYPIISTSLAQQLHHFRQESPPERCETVLGHQLFSPLISNMYQK